MIGQEAVADMARLGGDAPLARKTRPYHDADIVGAGRLMGAGGGVVVSFGVRKGRESPRKARKGLEQGMRVWEAGGWADAIRPYGGWGVLTGCSAWRVQGVFLRLWRVARNSRSRLFGRNSCARFFWLFCMGCGGWRGWRRAVGSTEPTLSGFWDVKVLECSPNFYGVSLSSSSWASFIGDQSEPSWPSARASGKPKVPSNANLALTVSSSLDRARPLIK